MLNSIKKSLIICTIIAIIITVFSFVVGNAPLAQLIKISFYLSFFYGFPLCIANMLLITKLNEIISWKQKPWTRLIVGFISALFITIIILLLLNFLQWVVIWGADFKDLFTERNTLFYVISLLITVFFFLAYQIKYIYSSIGTND